MNEKLHLQQLYHSKLKQVFWQQELTVQQRHSLVGGIESAVCDALISHKHHGHVGAGGGQIWRKGATTEPETNKQSCGWITNMCLLTEDLNKIQHLSCRPIWRNWERLTSPTRDLFRCWGCRAPPHNQTRKHPESPGWSSWSSAWWRDLPPQINAICTAEGKHKQLRLARCSFPAGDARPKNVPAGEDSSWGGLDWTGSQKAPFSAHHILWDKVL